MHSVCTKEKKPKKKRFPVSLRYSSKPKFSTHCTHIGSSVLKSFIVDEFQCNEYVCLFVYFYWDFSLVFFAHAYARTLLCLWLLCRYVQCCILCILHTFGKINGNNSLWNVHSRDEEGGNTEWSQLGIFNTHSSIESKSLNSWPNRMGCLPAFNSVNCVALVHFIFFILRFLFCTCATMWY